MRERQQFIKLAERVRLRYAAQLLRTTDPSVAMIASSDIGYML